MPCCKSRPWQRDSNQTVSGKPGAVHSVTDLEIEEAIREAWVIQQAGPDVPPSARRLAAALLAVNLGTAALGHSG